MTEHRKAELLDKIEMVATDRRDHSNLVYDIKITRADDYFVDILVHYVTENGA